MKSSRKKTCGSRSDNRKRKWGPCVVGMVPCIFVALICLAAVSPGFALEPARAPQTTAIPAPASAPVKGWVKVMSPTTKFHTSGTASVNCPPGKKVFGGGYNVAGPEGRLYIDDKFYVSIDRPTDDNAGWFVGWFSGGGRNFWVNVYAICADAN